jgi:hypothetical protein
MGFPPSLINFSKEKKVIVPDNSKWGAIKRWGSGVGKHLSTYSFESAVPVVAAVLSPMGGAVSAIEFGVYVGLASTSVGIGAYFRKLHEDQKSDLALEIANAKGNNFIPNYNNLAELRDYVRNQENELYALNKIPKGQIKVFDQILLDKFIALKEQEKVNDPLLQKKSILREYGDAFVETINPFDQSQIVKDSKMFAQTIAKVSGFIATAAAIGSGNGFCLVSASAATLVSVGSSKGGYKAGSKVIQESTINHAIAAHNQDREVEINMEKLGVKKVNLEKIPNPRAKEKNSGQDFFTKRLLTQAALSDPLHQERR